MAVDNMASLPLCSLPAVTFKDADEFTGFKDTLQPALLYVLSASPRISAIGLSAVCGTKNADLPLPGADSRHQQSFFPSPPHSQP